VQRGAFMREIKIGIIGCTPICEEYLHNFKYRYSFINPILVADENMDSAKLYSDKYCIKTCGIDEILADPNVEIVLNLTEAFKHEEINNKALMAGKHVYCEKPLAMTIEGVENIVALAKEKSLLLGGAPDTFYGAAWQSARKIIDDGWIGKPVVAMANFIVPGNEAWHSDPEQFYKLGRGPMLDGGIYGISVLIALLGPVKSVYCNTQNTFAERKIFSMPKRGQKFTSKVYTHYSGMMKFENDVYASITVSNDIWHSRLPYFEVHGSEGSMFLPDPTAYMARPKDFREPMRMIRYENILNDCQNLRGNDAADRVLSKINYKNLTTEMPITFRSPEDPKENLIGIGLVEMAHKLAGGGKFNVDDVFAAHCAEVTLGFDISAKNKYPYEIKSTCERPDPIDGKSLELVWGSTIV
jgi:predicted dehydrogenase